MYNQKEAWNTYVGNGDKEIRESININHWKHVQEEIN